MTSTVIQAEPTKLKRYLPPLSWLPTYQRKWLRFDILTGITVWGSTVSSAMGYAQIAGLPVQAGLYASMVALIAYAIFGTSSVLKVETSPSMAIISAAVVAPLAIGDYASYITLSAALAVTVRVILIVAGLARMGFLTDFLAKPVVGGFLFGLALIVILGQLPSLFGIDVLFTGFGESSNTFRVRWWVASYADKRRVTHKVCTAIQEAADKEGINMPYTTFTLDSVVVHAEDGPVLPNPASSQGSDTDE